MRRIFWHLLGRLYQARSGRALRKHVRLATRAEKFFLMVKESR